MIVCYVDMRLNWNYNRTESEKKIMLGIIGGGVCGSCRCWCCNELTSRQKDDRKEIDKTDGSYNMECYIKCRIIDQCF